MLIYQSGPHRSWPIWPICGNKTHNIEINSNVFGKFDSFFSYSQCLKIKNMALFETQYNYKKYLETSVLAICALVQDEWLTITVWPSFKKTNKSSILISMLVDAMMH